MCFLGILGLGLVGGWLARQHTLAKSFRNELPQFINGFLGQIDRVGAHVGNQADGLATDIHAFVELLGNTHGAAGGKTQLARCFLLQRRGGKGRGRIALALFFLDLVDYEFAASGS